MFMDCKIVDGIVTWMDENIDCAPEYMYENSYAYPAFQAIVQDSKWEAPVIQLPSSSHTSVKTTLLIFGSGK